MDCLSKKNCGYNCPVDATLKLIGGKYKSLILWRLTGRTLRFSELKALVVNATPKMLTQQLRELEADGLVERKVYAVIPPKVEYSLSKTGMTLKPILEAMYVWGEDYLRAKGLTVNCGMKTSPREAEKNIRRKNES
ncbi:MAG: helix-turn-helix transcriptional regulator [Clostridiales bacterium]|jgi:DNA-binding HxlR family transcriptional regulator|nr:helix-turn-helix transcriptional regulator [Clostridiales bacterium]